MSLPHDASLDGHLVDEALLHATLVGSVLLLGLLVWLVWALRGSRQPVRDGGWRALAFVAAVFLIAEGPLAWASLQQTKAAPPNALRVEVNAHRWAWDFRLPGEDGRLGTADDVLAWNELRVPVDTPVELQLGSADVVHGFNVPAFRVKGDAVPGQVNALWFEAREVGRYEIACSQHCGTNHYRMRGVVIVMPKDAFAAWQREASAMARIAYDPDDAAAHWGWEWK
jgi:cytochrome c oxidase subunit 2